VKAVDAHTLNRQAETNICQKADSNCFLEQETSANGGIHTTKDHNDIKKSTNKTV
jgi:hypothetical protein